MKIIDALICAAGQGKRMGLGHNKLFLELEGEPVLIHTLKVWEKHERIRHIVVVVAREERELIDKMIVEAGLTKVRPLTMGGTERQQSVFNGLNSYEAKERPDMILIHDGARPFITESLIDQVIEATEEYGAAVLAVPVKDTIKQATKNKFIDKTLDRSKLWSIQTPQAFRYTEIIKAHQQAEILGIQATDDAALMEVLGHQVYLVEGDYTNIKLTTPEDIELAEFLLKKRRNR